MSASRPEIRFEARTILRPRIPTNAVGSRVGIASRCALRQRPHVRRLRRVRSDALGLYCRERCSALAARRHVAYGRVMHQTVSAATAEQSFSVSATSIGVDVRGRARRLRTSALGLAAPLALILACGSSPGSSLGPAPAAGTLACTAGTYDCTCASASTASGACSPQTLGGASHCCATVTGGATTQCGCVLDANRCIQGTTSSGLVCLCTHDSNAFINPTGDTPADSCTKPSGGHCCKSPTSESCSCSASACGGASVDVDSCTLQNSVAGCLAPAIEVTSCR